MKKTSLLAVVLILSTLEASAQQCNFLCVQQLQSRGVPPWDVQRNCCIALPYNPAQVGQRCSSTAGPCMLPQQTLIGSPCYCATPFGPAGGQVTP